MASPGNPNQPQPQQQPFDMQKFFKPTNSPTPTCQNPNPNMPSTPFPIPPSSYPPPSGTFSYPPQTAPFHHQYQYHPHPPHPHHQIPYSQEQLPSNLHHQRSLSYPTPPLQPPPNYNVATPPNNPNSGARIMALLGAPSPNMELPPQPTSGVPEFSGPATVAVVPTIPMGMTPTGPIRMPSSKLPKGRHLNGDHVVYDVDVRLQGEVQPQLEVTPITKYGSDPQLVLGRQIAVNKSYICYGLKQGNIRVLNIHTALRSLFRAHTQVYFNSIMLVWIAFFSSAFQLSLIFLSLLVN